MPCPPPRLYTRFGRILKRQGYHCITKFTVDVRKQELTAKFDFGTFRGNYTLQDKEEPDPEEERQIPDID